MPLKFPHLSEPGDEVYVIIRNPRLIPPGELRPKNLETDAEGNPVDEDAAMAAMHEVFARLIVGWRVYSAAMQDAEQQQPMTLSEDGEIVAPDQELLAWPPTAEKVGELPLEILKELNLAIEEAANPR